MATPSRRAVALGDTLVFHDRDTGRELDVIAQRGSPDELLANLRGIYPPVKEALGVLALAFDHRPARPGRPLPMTAEEYAQTVPHHTVYGCLLTFKAWCRRG
ncbi:hypothetical protein [Streptomyces sp. CoH17]|uniref:hypothetical protein n=1 Tax=Streptomyces sp. CoH17 TaxID=2992806 RepID=UPI00226FFFD9|nr:hypothetical protein [Streptomyces sp. CoH17]